jgi:PmbA protein
VSALDVAARALAYGAAAADAADVFVHAERSGLARFAGSQQHQPTLIEDTVVTLRAVEGDRVGVAVTNRTSDDGLRALASRAAEAARRARPDPLFPGVAEPAPVADVGGFDLQTAELEPDGLARLAGDAIGVVKALEGTAAYGFVTCGETELAAASTAGLEAHQRLTDAAVLVLASGDGRSGYATRTASAVGAVDPRSCAIEATEKAARTSGAMQVAPRVYRAVLEPYALADLLGYFAWDAFSGLALLEERSYLTGRIGERIFDEKVTIRDDALDPRGLPKAFDFDGVPKQRVDLIENGVARGVVWDRRRRSAAGATRRAPATRLRSSCRPGGHSRSRSRSRQARATRSTTSSRRSTTGSTSRGSTTSGSSTRGAAC